MYLAHPLDVQESRFTLPVAHATPFDPAPRAVPCDALLRILRLTCTTSLSRPFPRDRLGGLEQPERPDADVDENVHDVRRQHSASRPS